jgi:uncharacterized protein YjdB
MAQSSYYDATKEDSRLWGPTENPRAATRDEDAVANAAAIQTATRAANPVTAFTLNDNAETLDLDDGPEVTFQLSVATTTPANKGVLVTWGSSDPTKATVDANGLVTAVAVGTTTITATAVHDTNVDDTCAITVVDSGA